MQFLTLYTPAVPPSGPPDPEHMQKLGKLMDTLRKAGVLVAAGGILPRSTGMKVVRRNGTFSVEHGPVPGSSLMHVAPVTRTRVQTPRSPRPT